jgi:glutaredoxin 2
MNLYEEVKNNKEFYEKLDDALRTLIDRYKGYFDSSKKDRTFILDNFERDLERVANLMDNYGYTYTPTDMEDVSEDIFETIVLRYLEGFQDFLDKGKSNIETINVDVKNLLKLIDKHKSISEHFI